MPEQAEAPAIPLAPVVSGMADGLGYDPATSTLAVRFAKGGQVYHYAGVPADVHDVLVRANATDGASVGKALREQVLGRYLATKVPK